MWNWVVVVGLAALRGLWVALANEPGVSNDSMRYWNPGDPFMVFRLDLGQGPGQLVQVLFLLLPPTVAIAVQAVAAGLLWGWAAIVAAGRRTWLFWVGLAWSFSPWWLTWDSRVLTEALMFAGLAVFAAGVGRILATPDTAGWAPVVAGMAVALLARPLVVILVAPILLIAVAPKASRQRARGWGLALVVGLVAWSGTQTVVFNTAQAHYHYLPQPQSMVRIQAQDRLAFRAGIPGYLDLAKAHGMPPCAAFDSTLKLRGDERLKALRASDQSCPQLADWLDDGGLPWWREVASNPYWTLRYVADPNWVLGASGGFSGDPRFSLLPGGAISGIMWATIAGGAVVLLWRGPRWWARGALVVGCGGFCLVMILVDGMEYWRHLAPGLVVLWWAAASFHGVSQSECGNNVSPVRGEAETSAEYHAR